MANTPQTKIEIRSCKRIYPNWWARIWPRSLYRDFLVYGTIYRAKPNGIMEAIQGFGVTVSPWCSEYDYVPKLTLREDEEELIQIAIGQYFQDNNIKIGTIGR